MRARRLVVRGLAGFAVVSVAAATGGYWYARPLLLTGTGYAAHNACAVTNVAGRDDPDADLPPNPLVPYLRTRTDGAATRASVLGVLAARKAWYTEGFGCTVAAAAPSLGPATPVDPARNPFTAAAAPAPSAAVTAALAAAFGDDLPAGPRAALGTRAVVVVHDGRIVAERYADGFDATTPQLGWSMAKSVTNLLTGRLVLQGKVSLTDAGLRPQWTDGRRDITVEHLLRMTSGLEWDETYALGTPITRMLYLEPDMAGYVAAQPLSHRPGTVRQYSSGSTNLLCSVLVERGGAAADLPRRELFAPLGLGSAVWEPDAAGTPVCSSYLWATPRDWAAIGRFALDDGVQDGVRLLPEGWMAASTRVDGVPPGEDAGYGAGWWVNREADGSLVDPLLPADAYWASGHDGQRMVVVPSADLVVVRLGFTPGEDDDRTSALVRDIVAAVGG